MTSREIEARRIRVAAADAALSPYPEQTPNGEAERYRRPDGRPSHDSRHSKGLPHDRDGVVDADAYAAFDETLRSGQAEALVRLGVRAEGPLAGLPFEILGPDPAALALAPAPTLDGAEAAAELAELYWMALLRDVPFARFEAEEQVGEAVRQLNLFYAFSGTAAVGPGRVRAVLRPETLFRGVLAGDRDGPYLSQFLWRGTDGVGGRIVSGALTIDQRVPPLPRADYATTWDAWLRLQNGGAERPAAAKAAPKPRFLVTPRDLAGLVAGEPGLQPWLNAARLLAAEEETGRRAAASVWSAGPLHLEALLAEVAVRALRAAHFQKWHVHRRPRPEAMAGLVERNRRIAMRGETLGSVPIHPQLAASGVLDVVAAREGTAREGAARGGAGTWLLPLAYPAGAPASPSYCSGHAAVAGACATVLKAWFDEARRWPNLVEPNPAGTRLVRRDNDEGLTVGGELHKLASNLALGRSFAGVSYFSDVIEGLWLGENVAVGVLREQRLGNPYPERLAFTPMFGTDPVAL